MIRRRALVYPKLRLTLCWTKFFSDAETQVAFVSKNGVIIGERYADGYGAKSLGTSRFVAKSFSSAAIGVAIAEGRFTSVAEKASIVLDEFVGTDKKAITLEQKLHMRPEDSLRLGTLYAQEGR